VAAQNRLSFSSFSRDRVVDPVQSHQETFSNLRLFWTCDRRNSFLGLGPAQSYSVRLASPASPSAHTKREQECDGERVERGEELYRCWWGASCETASPFRVWGFLWCDEMAESLIAGPRPCA